MRIPLALPMFILGLAGLAVTVPDTSAPPSRAEAPKKAKPFLDRMRCPKWKEGLARTVVVTVKEDEHGNFLGARCERPQEASK